MECVGIIPDFFLANKHKMIFTINHGWQENKKLLLYHKTQDGKFCPTKMSGEVKMILIRLVLLPSESYFIAFQKSLLALFFNLQWKD